MPRRMADATTEPLHPTSSPASSTITLPSSLLAEKKSASEKRHHFLRKFIIYHHMDFDYAAWQMLHLFMHPRRLYRSFLYRKRNKDQFARDDPAFLILVLLLIFVLTVGFALANVLPFTQTLKLHLWVYVDFFCVSLIVTTLFWYLTNHYLRDSSLEEGDDIEWGYCFDVHINSYVPFATILHLYLIIYSCFLTPETPDYRIVTIVGNTVWMVAILYYLYINFMGYAFLRNLQRGVRLLYPMTVTVVVYLVTVILNWNVCRWIVNFWIHRVAAI